MKISKLVKLSAIVAVVMSTNSYSADETLTSAEIGTLATVAAIDKGEILVSAVAENKKAPNLVDDYAKMMITQHGNNLAQILEMAGKFNVSELTGGDSDKLTDQNKADLMKLGALEGSKFNAEYADAMVSGHEAALKLIDDDLMKTAENKQVKKFLTETRAAVVEHLKHAKKLQSHLKT